MTQFLELADDGRILAIHNCDTAPGVDCPLVENPNPFGTDFWGLGETPTHAPYWANGTATWVQTASLDDLKVTKRAEINAAYRLANDTSFTYDGKEFQADAHAMKQITVTHGGIVGRGALKPDWSGYWKAMDNSYVPIPDVATWWAFYDAIEATGQANFDRAQELKARVDSATTPEELADISWTAPT